MFTAKTLDRLASERIVWMTTVDPHGQPQTSPVWYLWDGDAFVIYSLDPTPRLDNIEANPRVALNLDGNGSGGDIVTIEGSAIIDRTAPGPHEVAAYVERYRDRMDRGWGGPSQFAARYPTLIRVTPTRVRQW
jgi:PPOX class probable F420-dependent enzyme